MFATIKKVNHIFMTTKSGVDTHENRKRKKDKRTSSIKLEFMNINVETKRVT